MWRGWADLERVNISWCLRHHLRAALGIVLRFGELLSIKSKDFRLTHNRRSTGKTTMLVAGSPTSTFGWEDFGCQTQVPTGLPKFQLAQRIERRAKETEKKESEYTV